MCKTLRKLKPTNIVFLVLHSYNLKDVHVHAILALIHNN